MKNFKVSLFHILRKKKETEVSTKKQEITILVTDDDKTGRDVMKMSDFFAVTLQEMAKVCSANPHCNICVLRDKCNYA